MLGRQKNENTDKLTDMSKPQKLKQRQIIHLVLSILVVIVMIRQFFLGNYNNVFVCVMTLVLFMIPAFVDRHLNIRLPLALEAVIMFFIFAAEILGEIQSFYTIIPYWDTILHTINGFMMAAIGFAMIDILNQDPHFHINLSPLFVAFVAFCFSMTIGVLWEFFEYTADQFFLTDMQKDWLVGNVSSVLINPSGLNDPILIKDVTKTVISGTIDGVPQDWVINNAYLDLGLIDTMKDLIVNCIGAVVFSVIGLIYIKNRGRNRFVASFIPQLKTEEEIEATEATLKAQKEELAKKRERKQEEKENRLLRRKLNKK
ncbi:MAG: hypothetical protein MRZ66_03885 [Clostridiales bacterium]|nr:hypothetical protein [Clostridiales bacterium]